MPPMIKRSDLSKIHHALDQQRRTGRASLRLTNRCTALVSGSTSATENSNQRLVPKPMKATDVEAVVKLTGSSPFIETKFVRG